jgi:hypothetical protein
VRQGGSTGDTKKKQDLIGDDNKGGFQHIGVNTGKSDDKCPEKGLGNRYAVGTKRGYGDIQRRKEKANNFM